MRWAKTVFLFFAIIYSVLSEETDAEPTLRIMARSSVYNVGEKKGIYCEGTNVAEPIEWFSPTGDKIEGRSNKNNRVYVEKRSREPNLVALIITTKLKDSGNWTCKAGDLSETIEIIVGEKVVMAVKSENLVADEGRNIILSCEAKGIPTPVVQWYMENTPISEAPNKYIIRRKEDNYTLEIRNLTHADAGEYSCKVTQKALSHYTDKTIQLTVHHKPILYNPDTGELYPPPESASQSRMEEVFAVLNDTKTITCNVIAVPPPTFHWYRRVKSFDKPITEEDMISTSEDRLSSSLILLMREETDTGLYKCTASNLKGRVSVIFDVSLGEAPHPPTSINLVSANASYIIFNVTCENCTLKAKETPMKMDPENLPIDGYSFQLARHYEDMIPDWDQAEEIIVDIEDEEDTFFEVGPLANTTKYHVRVRARNAAGFSDWLDLLEMAATTSHTMRLVATVAVVIIALVMSMFY